ncbi:MAG: putative metal-binding motif-containing protein [Sandaracinus sp.]|nr:putative metal-binding motif-containing protein [Sandaracinus sp.]MCB9636297.1 putative metal-binding motif-containing protein [Sandaracinus sp.]
MSFRFALVLTLFSLGLAGCTGGSASATASARVTARAELSTTPTPVALVGATPAEGARAMEIACDTAAPELCNALDDDCDGRLDEDASCPYEPGEVQVVVAWNSDADVDLYLTEPSGTTASFQSPSAAGGLEIQHAGRGACVEDPGPAARVESARIARNAAPGTYAVALHYLMECDADGGPTTALVSLSVGGRHVGTWTYLLTPSERLQVLEFELQ